MGHRQDSLYCALQALPVRCGIELANSVATLFGAHSFRLLSAQSENKQPGHTRLFVQNSPFGSFAFSQGRLAPFDLFGQPNQRSPLGR